MFLQEYNICIYNLINVISYNNVKKNKRFSFVLNALNYVILSAVFFLVNLGLTFANFSFSNTEWTTWFSAPWPHDYKPKLTSYEAS